MNQYIKKLKEYMTGQADDACCEDAQSVLGLLFYIYISEKPVHNTTIKHRFQELDRVIDRLSVEENDIVSNLVCDLCVEHARCAFLEGIHVGFALHTELLEVQE